MEKESHFHVRNFPIIMNQASLKVLFLQAQENKSLFFNFFFLIEKKHTTKGKAMALTSVHSPDKKKTEGKNVLLS